MDDNRPSMDDNGLSQAEIESLLSVVGSVDAALHRTPAARLSPNRAESRERAIVSSYDFRRPLRGNEQLTRAIHALHEGFAAAFAETLSAQLRTSVEVRVASVLEQTCHDFASSLENPTCLHVLRAEPLPGKLAIEWNPSILFPLIDRLLGGGKDSGPIARRPLTEIEQRLASRFTTIFLQDLKRAWEHVAPLTLSVERTLSNSQLVPIPRPEDSVIVVAFEAVMGEARGTIHLCLPLRSLHCVRPKLLPGSESSQDRSGPTAQSRAMIGRQLDRSLVDVVVTVAETRLATADLMGLTVGDVITTDKDFRAPIDVAVQGINKFQASPGALKGNKAIRVETAPAAMAEDAARITAKTA